MGNLKKKLKTLTGWLFSPRMIRRSLFSLACWVTLVALFYTVENWRGKRSWEKYKAELLAKGEHLDPEWFFPKPVPDDENFAKTPLFEAAGYRNGYMDTNKTAADMVAQTIVSNISVLYPPEEYSIGDHTLGRKVNLKSFQEWLRANTNKFLPPAVQEPAADVVAVSRNFPEFNELRVASRLPYSRMDYSMDFEHGKNPNFRLLRALANSFAIAAAGELSLGDSQRAFESMEVLRKLSDSLEGHPTTVAAMIRTAIMKYYIQIFWEGWSEAKWTEQQLITFQSYFEEIDLLKNADHAIRGEGAVIGRIVENAPADRFGEILNFSKQKEPIRNFFVSLAPRGWVYQNMLYYNWLLHETAFSLLDVQKQQIYPNEARKGSDLLNNQIGGHPYKILAWIAIPNFSKAVMNVGRSQTYVNEAAIVCALERYRHVTGEFPERLDMLVPKFIGRIPHDIIGGQPLKYHPAEDGKIMLYSVGWNGKDDCGEIVLVQPNEEQIKHHLPVVKNVNFEEGDWVWRYPSRD